MQHTYSNSISGADKLLCWLYETRSNIWGVLILAGTLSYVNTLSQLMHPGVKKVTLAVIFGTFKWCICLERACFSGRNNSLFHLTSTTFTNRGSDCKQSVCGPKSRVFLMLSYCSPCIMEDNECQNSKNKTHLKPISNIWITNTTRCTIFFYFWMYFLFYYLFYLFILYYLFYSVSPLHFYPNWFWSFPFDASSYLSFTTFKWEV